MVKYVVKFVKIEISADNVHKNICGIRILFFYTFCKKMCMKSCIKFSRFFKTKKNESYINKNKTKKIKHFKYLQTPQKELKYFENLFFN